MWLCYVDECGNTGLKLDDARQPYHLLVAVAVPEDQVQALTRAVHDLVDDALEDKWGFPPSPRPELHAVDLWGGRAPWTELDTDQRNELYRQALYLLEPHEACVFIVAIDKAKLMTRYTRPQSPHLLALQFLTERIDDWLLRQQDPLRQRAILVADETKEHERPSIALLGKMQRVGPPIGRGGALKRIVDTVHFVRSGDNAGVQLADIVAYAVHRALKAPGTPTKNGDIVVMAFWNTIIKPRVADKYLWPRMSIR